MNDDLRLGELLDKVAVFADRDLGLLHPAEFHFYRDAWEVAAWLGIKSYSEMPVRVLFASSVLEYQFLKACRDGVDSAQGIQGRYTVSEIEAGDAYPNCIYHAGRLVPMEPAETDKFLGKFFASKSDQYLEAFEDGSFDLRNLPGLARGLLDGMEDVWLFRIYEAWPDWTNAFCDKGLGGIDRLQAWLNIQS